jgi:hypothetical protein
MNWRQSIKWNSREKQNQGSHFVLGDSLPGRNGRRAADACPELVEGFAARTVSEANVSAAPSSQVIRYMLARASARPLPSLAQPFALLAPCLAALAGKPDRVSPTDVGGASGNLEVPLRNPGSCDGYDHHRIGYGKEVRATIGV